MVTQKTVTGSKKINSIPWLFIAPAMLWSVHAIAVVALFGFGWRVGNLPISPTGLDLYLAATSIFGLIFLIGASRAKRTWSLTRVLLLLSIPAFISLVLNAILWMTPWLGNAPYAPWDPGDGDTVAFLNLIFAFLWIGVAILYGLHRYLLTGGIAQIAVYIMTQQLPFWSLLPVALIGLLVFGGGLVSARKRVAPEFQPSLWVAVLMLTAVGSFTFFIAWSQLPENGMVLGWTETLTQPARQVPDNAWNWTRPAAQALLYLAVAAVPLSGMAQWLTARKK